MSSSVLAPDTGPSPSSRRRPSRRRRPNGPVGRAWVLTHRWASLVLGLLLLVETTSGAVLLYQPEINELVHPERYTVTPSATPVNLLDALRSVQATYPELGVTSASIEDGGAYVISGDGDAAAFVDPGTGSVTLGEQSLWIMRLLVNIHECALTCDGYPAYQAWMNAPLDLLSTGMTLGGFLLGTLGVVLLLLVVSGIVIWWPGIRGWISGFVVRRGRGPYVRDLDLHRVVGIAMVPFLFLWAFTGASFEFAWPEQVYFALLPGESTPEPTVEPGTGPQIRFEDAMATAVAAHPRMHVSGLYESTPADPGGSYGVSLENAAGTAEGYVSVDSHGGGVGDYYPRADDASRPFTEQLWDDGTVYELHFGTIVGGWWRIVWLVCGLSPILLGITGVTIWLTKRRGRRTRRARTAATAEA